MPRRNSNALQTRTRRRSPKSVKVLTPVGTWVDMDVLHESGTHYILRHPDGGRTWAAKLPTY